MDCAAGPGPRLKIRGMLRVRLRPIRVVWKPEVSNFDSDRAQSSIVGLERSILPRIRVSILRLSQGVWIVFSLRLVLMPPRNVSCRSSVKNWVSSRNLLMPGSV